MILYLLSACYVLSGVIVAAALISDKNANTCRKETFFCIAAGVLWPLCVFIAASYAFYENVKERQAEKRRARRERIIVFSRKLVKLGLIREETYLALYKRLTHK
jgi:hypothetical protein